MQMGFSTMMRTRASRLAAYAALSAAIAAPLAAPAPADAAAAQWAPYPVQVWETPFEMDSERRSHDYTPLESAEGDWQLCVALPHMKDSYWKAVNFGLVEAAKRLDVGMTIKTAGGYTELDKQKQDLRECARNGADAVIVGAIAKTGLNDVVEDLAEKDIPVIDLVNGVSSDAIAAKSMVDFGEMGGKTGKYLAGEMAGEDVRVAWFPGPEDAAWVSAGDAGFKDAVSGTSIEIATTVHGDTTPETQKRLIESALAEHDGLDVIAGTAVTASTAAEILAEKGRAGDVDVIAYYLTPTVYKNVQRGRILAAPTDSPVIQARIAVDQAVRILAGKAYKKHVGPEIIVLDRSTINFFDYLSALPPRDFEPVTRVN